MRLYVLESPSAINEVKRNLYFSTDCSQMLRAPYTPFMMTNLCNCIHTLTNAPPTNLGKTMQKLTKNWGGLDLKPTKLEHIFVAA